jgi:hypothetical protein
MNKLLLVLCLVVLRTGWGQDVHPSDTYIRTCINDLECSSINSSSYLFYNEGKGKFYIMIDFNRAKTGIDSVDFWLNDLSGTYFYFKAPLMREQLPGMSNYNQKTFKLVGQAFLNNVWHNQTMEVTFIRADNDMQSNTINANKMEALRVNLSFEIIPKHFNIHKKPQRLTNIIFVGIGSGKLNPLLPENQNMLGEAYAHGD